MSSVPPIVVGITGASGAPYAVRLLQQLTSAHRPVSLIVSKFGMRLLETEVGIGSIDALRSAVGEDAWEGSLPSSGAENRSIVISIGWGRASRDLTAIPVLMTPVAAGAPW